MAFTTYQKILILNENLPRVRLELAQTYLALKMPKEAKKEFEIVLGTNPPKVVQDKIKNRLEFIESLSSKNRFNFMLAFNHIVDSNINNAPADDVYSIFPFLKDYTIITRAIAEDMFAAYLKKVKATSNQYIIGINHKYLLNDAYTINNVLSYISQQYNKLDGKNIEIVSFTSSIDNIQDKQKNSFNLGINQIKAKDVNLKLKPFMLSYNIGYNYSYIWSKYFINNFNIKITQKQFYDKSLKDKESRTFTVALTPGLKTKKYGTFNFNLLINKDKKTKGSRTDIDNINYTVGLSNRYNITKSFSSTISTSFYKKYYDDLDLNYESKRYDTTKTNSLTLSYNITRSLSTNLNATNIVSKSNQGAFVFDKNIYTFGMTYSF
jgi:hypothetical protein